MTREKFIEELNFNCKVDGKEVWLNIMPCLEKLLYEHESELKQAYIEGSNSNNGLIKFYLKQIEEKDKEIEKLRSIVEEAIKKPMGVEPHSWSDYKIKKATT
jgi:hypothetical protein